MFTTHCSCCEDPAWRTWLMFDSSGTEVTYGAFGLRPNGYERANAYACVINNAYQGLYPFTVAGHHGATGAVRSSVPESFVAGGVVAYRLRENVAGWAADICGLDKRFIKAQTAPTQARWIGLPAVPGGTIQALSTFDATPSGNVTIEQWLDRRSATLASGFGPFAYNATRATISPALGFSGYTAPSPDAATLYSGAAYSTSTSGLLFVNIKPPGTATSYSQCLGVVPQAGASATLKGGNRLVLGDAAGVAQSYPVGFASFDPAGPITVADDWWRTIPGPYLMSDFWNTQRIVSVGAYSYTTNGMEDPTKYRNAFQGLHQRTGAAYGTLSTAGAPGTPYFALAADSTHVFASYYSGGTGKVERRAHASFSTVDWTYNRGAARVKCLAVDSSGNVYWGGEVSAGVSYGKLNSSGVSQWTGNHGATVHGIAVDGSGNVYIAGEEDGSGSHYTLRKLNSAGTLQWSQSHYGTDQDGANSGAFYDVDVTTDGSRIIACGKTVEY